MKTNKFLWIVLMTVCFTGFVSCLESGDETLVVPDINKVDIKNPEDIQNSLIIKDGKLTSGEMPASTSGNNNLSSSISSILINSGGTIFLPIIYNSGFEIESVYFQVLGVDGNFYSVKPTIITSNDKITYISVKIPEKIDNGTFNFIYKIKDKSNSISNGVNVLVEVTNVVASCENNHKTGQSGLTFTSLYLGDTGGKVIIDYDT